MILKLRSGSAVTEPEANRMIAEMGDLNSDEVTFKKGVVNVYKFGAEKLLAQANALHSAGL